LLDSIVKTLLYFDVMYNVEILDNLIKIESLFISPSPIKKNTNSHLNMRSIDLFFDKRFSFFNSIKITRKERLKIILLAYQNNVRNSSMMSYAALN